MWHLEFLTPKQENEYLDLIIKKVKIKRDLIHIESVKRFLNDEKIKEILISKPNFLYNNKNEYKTSFFENNEYDLFIAAKSSRNRNPVQEALINKYQFIFDVFNYENFISKNKIVSYKIAQIIGQNTCIYCNRQYIFTVDENDSKITRPEFDHYFPKSTFPFFALSLYNLIPSCHICNSNCKGDKEISCDMNPYLTSKNDYFKFSYNVGKNGLPTSVDIKVFNSDKKNEVKTLLECFKIKEIYDCHTNLELMDLYLFKTKYSDTYLNEILNKISSDFDISTQEEAYRILFGTELLEKKNNNRPLSKFKRDILKELGII